jgi:rod shape-determining protein MreC
MHNLIEFFIRYKYWFVFLLLEACSLIMLFRSNSYQGSVYFTTANTVAGTYYSVISDLTSFFGLKKVNEGLSSDNTRLLLQIQELKDEISKLKTDTVETQDYGLGHKLIDAKVVNATLHRNNNLITINKGSADGVHPEMGVICSRGVVGIVSMTSEHYSIIMPLVNTTSSISCRLSKSLYFGTMKWQRGAINISYVTDVPRHAKIKPGETVETNGYSDIFPAGLPIGQVLNFENSADGMAYHLRVKLFTDFSTLRDVSVIADYVNQERKLLEAQADSLTSE